MSKKAAKCRKRILIAGFGSYLNGDDSFGVRLLYEVESDMGKLSGIDLLEVGTNGMLLVQQLLDDYDVLIILDAIAMSGEPGRLYVMKLEGIEDSHEHIASIAQLHEVNPQSALYIAKAIGVLPKEVFIVGCEPSNIDLDLDLSKAVKDCMSKAKSELKRIITDLCHMSEEPANT